jgi:serine/threonine protein kinase
LTWERWRQRLTPDDFAIADLRHSDDSNDYEFSLLSPLGHGVSSSVYVCLLLRSPATPHLEGFLYALKLFKSDAVSASQGANECDILSCLHRIPGTRNTFPLLHGHFKVRGHLALLLELCGHNLLQVIGLRDYAGLPLTMIRPIMTQLLSGLAVLEAAGLFTRTLSPRTLYSRSVDSAQSHRCRTIWRIWHASATTSSGANATSRQF